MKILSRLYPLFLGVVMFNCIRLTTDLSKDGVLWAGSLKLHLNALGLSVFVSYLFDYLARLFLDRLQPKLKMPVVFEYLFVIGQFCVMANLLIYIGDCTGFIYLGNRIADYIIVNVIYLPLVFMYYILVRSSRLEGTMQRQTLQLEQTKVEQLELELKFLRSQYHPHFLFNTLNTVYFQIDEKNETPRRLIEKLSELLRYQLYESNETVPIQDEVDYLRAYMEVQMFRANKRLQLEVDFSDDLKAQRVYPLLFLPLVENAFKYVGGDYRISCKQYAVGSHIVFEVTNTVPPDLIPVSTKKGIGLENLKRRLDLLYPGKYNFEHGKQALTYKAILTIEVESL